MRPFLSLRTLFRTPLKTFLIFILIAAASFAVVSRVTDLAITSREVSRVSSFYRGICALDTGIPASTADIVRTSMLSLPNDVPPALTKDEIDAFSSLKQVTSVDTRYMTAGIIDFNLGDEVNRSAGVSSNIANIGDSAQNFAYSYTSRFIIEATYQNSAADGGILTLCFEDCKILAGDPSILLSSYLNVQVFTLDGLSRSISRAGSGFVEREYYYIKNNPYGQSFVNTLIKGNRYLLIGRWEPHNPINTEFLGDQDTLNFCPSVINLTGKPENYLETEEFAPVRELIDITNSDKNTVDMVYTSDMRSIPRFSEQKSVIKQGRALTADDTNACIVSGTFLRMNHLKLGDTINVGLCSKLFEQNCALGAIAYTPDRYSTPVKNVNLTIVGTYEDTDTVEDQLGTAFWSYSVRTIFVPLSLLPVEVPKDHVFKPGEYSFIIGDPRNIDGFLKDAKPLADKFGVKLRFDDGGWLEVSNNISTGRITSTITASLFLTAAAVALLLAIYVFIWRNKKVYVIMRALGTPRGKIQSSLVLPLAFLTILAVPLGGLIGLNFTSKSVVPVLKAYTEIVPNYTPDASIPISIAFACFIGIIMVLIALTFLFLRKLAKTSPLDLMQGDRVNIKVKKISETKSGVVTPVSQFTPVSVPNTLTPKHGKYSALNHIISYIFRHIRRTKWKSVMLILLAVLMCGAMGTLTIVQTSYSKMDIKGYLAYGESDALADAAISPLLKDVYYWGKMDGALCGTQSTAVYVTNNVDRCLNDLGAKNYNISYIDGFQGLSVERSEFIISKELAQALGISLGGETYLVNEINKNKNMNDSAYSDIYKMNFKVAGIIDSPDLGLAVFAPAHGGLEKVFLGKYTIKNCEFTIADNTKIKEAQDFVSTLETRSRRIAYYAKSSLDKAELDNITKTMKLLKALFPVSVVVAVIIGLFASGLSIMQSSKEVAVLRVLGTTKKRTRCMLIFEEIILCMLGIAVAMVGLVMYNIDLFSQSAETIIFCIILYFLGCLCAIIFIAYFVTKNKVLEILQVKE
ncbi:MAG: hypothetical protein FWC47_11475 [Oscillospiraceae bacterium]|nr:hypothetical protein [Oscillospiraceae bacterium]